MVKTSSAEAAATQLLDIALFFLPVTDASTGEKVEI